MTQADNFFLPVIAASSAGITLYGESHRSRGVYLIKTRSHRPQKSKQSEERCTP